MTTPSSANRSSPTGREGVPDLLHFAVPLLAAAVALVWTHRRQASERPRTVTTSVLAVLAVLLALASLVQVIRAGDSGAQAVWGRRAATGKG